MAVLLGLTHNHSKNALSLPKPVATCNAVSDMVS
jgi:hypothetical protein